MLFVFLGGCAGQGTPTQVAGFTITSPVLPPPTLTPTSTLAPTSTYSPTPIPLLPTTTSVITPETTFDPLINLRYQCLDTIPYNPGEIDITGTMVLEGGIGEYYTLNLDSGRLKSLSTDYQEVFAVDVSPNNEQIFYLGCMIGEGCVGVVENTSEVVASFNDRSYWRQLWWLDNERLVILHDKEQYNSAIVFNPFTEQEIVITLDLPNAYYSQTIENTRVLISSIDPTLTRIVYFDPEGIGRVIMAQVPSGGILAWLPFPVADEPTGPKPNIDYRYGWSPDGKQYLTTSPVTYQDTEAGTPAAVELFSINIDGEVRQLTHFSAEYGFVSINHFRWSPDGRYLAFWYEAAINPDHTPAELIQQLAVYDFTTQETIDYCLPFGIARYSLSGARPVWSPDSRQLAVNTRSYNGQDHVLVLDPINGFITEVKEGISPIGWMLNIP